MNLIPLFPALQQGATPQTATDLVPAENSETGFDELLKQTIPASTQTSLPVSKFPTSSSNTTQGIIDAGEGLLSNNSLFDSAGTVNTPAESRTAHPHLTGDAVDQNRGYSTPGSTLELNTTDHHFPSKTNQTIHISVSISAQFSDGNEITGTQTLPAENDFQFSPSRSAVHRFALDMADTEMLHDSDFHIFTYGRTIESGKIFNPLETKHSPVTGMPGSIGVTPSMVSPAAAINTNDSLSSPNFLKPGEAAFQQQSPLSLTTSTLAASYSETDLDFKLLDAKVPSDHRFLSISIQGGGSQTAPGSSRNVEGTTLMVAELQNLISRNNDKVDMTISFQSRRTPSTGMHYLNSAPIQVETASPAISAGLLTAAGAGTAIPVSDPLSWSKNDSSAFSLKQNVHDQPVRSNQGFFEPAGEHKNDNQSSQQNLGSQNNNSMQSQTTMVQPGTTLSSDPTVESTFSSQFQESTSPLSNPVSKSTAPQPSMQPHYVQEHEILNQIVNRFTLQSRLQTSRISLQLTPAELGELKIDIVVKGDSLKANIYVQTRQAQEIIDKNIQRLKDVLQNSGISVDDLVVSFKSDNIDDFSNQHGRLFQEQNQLFDRSTNPQTTASFDHTIEESMLDRTQEPSGVNLTI